MQYSYLLNTSSDNPVLGVSEVLTLSENSEEILYSSLVILHEIYSIADGFKRKDMGKSEEEAQRGQVEAVTSKGDVRAGTCEGYLQPAGF